MIIQAETAYHTFVPNMYHDNTHRLSAYHILLHKGASTSSNTAGNTAGNIAGNIASNIAGNLFYLNSRVKGGDVAGNSLSTTYHPAMLLEITCINQHFQSKHKLICCYAVSHDVILNVRSLPDKDSVVHGIDLHNSLAFYSPLCKVIINFFIKITENYEQYCWKVEHVQHCPQ